MYSLYKRFLISCSFYTYVFVLCYTIDIAIIDITIDIGIIMKLYDRAYYITSIVLLVLRVLKHPDFPFYRNLPIPRAIPSLRRHN